EMLVMQDKANNASTPHPGARHHNSQILLVAQAREVHMLQGILGTTDGHGDTYIARDQGEHMGGAFHEFLHVRNARERTVDNVLVLMRKSCITRDLLNIIAIALGRGYAARRSMRLLEVPCVRKVSHHIADRRRTQPLTIGACKRTRSYGLAGGDERLHDGRKDFAFPLTTGSGCRHTSSLVSRWAYGDITLAYDGRLSVLFPLTPLLSIFRCKNLAKRFAEPQLEF